MLEDPMNESVSVLVQDLLDEIYDLDWEGVISDNKKALVRLDAETADKYITNLEEHIEELECCAEDYYQLDKDKLNSIVKKALKNMFDDLSLPDDWVAEKIIDVVDDIESECEKYNENKDI